MSCENLGTPKEPSIFVEGPYIFGEDRPLDEQQVWFYRWGNNNANVAEVSQPVNRWVRSHMKANATAGQQAADDGGGTVWPWLE